MISNSENSSTNASFNPLQSFESLPAVAQLSIVFGGSVLLFAIAAVIELNSHAIGNFVWSLVKPLIG